MERNPEKTEQGHEEVVPIMVESFQPAWLAIQIILAESKNRNVHISWIQLSLLHRSHDWKGNVSAQIEYSHLSERWTYPDYFYSVNHTMTSNTAGSSKNYSVEIIMVDTVVLTLDFAVEQGDFDEGKQYVRQAERKETRSS